MRALLQAIVAVAVTSVTVSADTVCTTVSDTISSVTASWKRADGFLPFYTKGDSDAVLLEIDSLGQDILYGVSLSQGAGSKSPRSERGMLQDLRLCRLERIGRRVLLTQRSTQFREGLAWAGSRALEESFASSVLASFGIEAEEHGKVLIDVAPFLRSEQHVGPWAPKDWKVDASRSFVATERSGSFPQNTDFETLVTLVGDVPSEGVSEFLPEARTLSLRLHHTFMSLPSPGFETRPADPRVGFFGPTYRDLNAVLDEPLDHSLAARWRIVKKETKEPVAGPESPITLYIDPSIPQRYRGAVQAGALWWNSAFEAAGFREAIRVRDLPEGASLVDARLSGIQWIHRADWAESDGRIQTDPRTGEILHAVVSLDSTQIRKFRGFVPANVPPHAGTLQAEIMYLTAHEVGHALGLAHNMAASTYSGSVMDYLPAPFRLGTGEASATDEYVGHVGPYDEMAIRWAYSPGLDPPALESIVREGLLQGLVYPEPEDARWSEWDLGPDPIRWLSERMALRKALLSQLAVEGVRPGEPASQLYKRFESVYELHLAGVDAVSRRVGGVLLARGVGGDGQQAPMWLPIDEQRRALRAVLTALSVEELAIPDKLSRVLVAEPSTSAELGALTESGMAFTNIALPRLVSAMILDGLLANKERLARLAVGSHMASLSLDEVLQTVVEETWHPPPADPKGAAISRAVQGSVVEMLLEMAKSPTAVPEARAAALDHLSRLRARLASYPARDVEGRAHLRLLRRQIDEFLRPPRTAG